MMEMQMLQKYLPRLGRVQQIILEELVFKLDMSWIVYQRGCNQQDQMPSRWPGGVWEMASQLSNKGHWLILREILRSGRDNSQTAVNWRDEKAETREDNSTHHFQEPWQWKRQGVRWSGKQDGWRSCLLLSLSSKPERLHTPDVRNRCHRLQL